MSRASVAQRRIVFAAASGLLQYPDEDLVGMATALRSSLPQLPRESAIPIARFLDHLSREPLLDLQSEYVATFDMKRRNCLYLTYYLNGDTRLRGMALWRFQEAFRQRGFAVEGGELPDFLPAVLELAAIGHEDMAVALLLEHQAGIRVLGESLDEMRSPYADVIRAVEITLPEPSPEITAAAHSLAAQGPPVEAVGLEPFFSVDSLKVRS
ncbi:MAG: nitrate reductase molybdenum cofactor assembly chaperone [Actinobacteria bacterium]|nr:nitrate reductase molybdenum cofactor assembly chaperone [Actinomycetota bacterium]MSW37423.1 nitrate reductase molybdenum cofactor assembly chaperone [Actinomycetota bacterium]